MYWIDTTCSFALGIPQSISTFHHTEEVSCQNVWCIHKIWLPSELQR